MHKGVPMNRRSLLKAFLATAALALPLGAQAADQSFVEEYNGPDNPASFSEAIETRSRNAVVLNVFHATWCGPCKYLFGQMAEIRKQPGVNVVVMGVDIDKYPKVTKANLAVVATPQSFVYADGWQQDYKFMGVIKNTDEMTRYLRDLNNFVKAQQAPTLKP